MKNPYDTFESHLHPFVHLCVVWVYTTSRLTQKNAYEHFLLTKDLPIDRPQTSTHWGSCDSCFSVSLSVFSFPFTKINSCEMFYLLIALHGRPYIFPCDSQIFVGLT